MNYAIRLRWARRIENKCYYGWVIVGIMLTSNLAAFSVNPTFGLFVTPLEQEFGWQRTTLAMAPMLGTIAGAVMAPLMGILADRLGVRPLLIGGGLFAAFCYVMLSQARSLWQFYLFYGPMFGVLASGVGLLGSNVAITHWFERRRARAMALVMMGASGGAFFFIGVQSFLIDNFGWRSAFMAQGGFALLFISLPSLLFMINTPEELGAGVRDAPSSGDGRYGIARGGGELSWSFREAVRVRAFWLTLAGTMLGTFCVAGYFTHAVPHMENLGFSRALAGSAWATFFFTGVFAKFLWGYITELTGVRWSLVMLYLGETLGLYLLKSAREPADLFIFAVVTGLCHGPFLHLGTQVWGDYFGRGSIGRIYGSVQPAIVLAAALGPVLGGMIFDRMGHYSLFFQILMVASLLAALVFFLDHPPGSPVRGGGGEDQEQPPCQPG